MHLAVDDVSGKAQEIGRLRHVGSKSHGLVDLAGTPHNQLLLGQGGGSTPGGYTHTAQQANPIDARSLKIWASMLGS